MAKAERVFVKEEPDSDKSDMSQAESDDATPVAQSKAGDTESESD